MKLSKKDLQLLQEIDGTGRKSYSQIGKAISLTKETTRNKFLQLQKDGVITYTYPLHTNTDMLYHAYLTLQQTSPVKEKMIEEFIKNHPSCVFVYVCEGVYNFKLLLKVQTNAQLISFFEDLRKEFNKIIKEKEIHAIDLYQKFKFNSSECIAKIHSSKDSAILNDKQKTILHSINKDGRKPVVDISQETGLTARVVTHQLKLLRPHISTFAAQFDAIHLNKLRCFIDVSLHNLDIRSQMVYFFAKKKLLRTAVTQLGKYDLSLELFVDSIDELRNLITEFKEDFYKNYVFFNTAIVLDTGFNGWYNSESL